MKIISFIFLFGGFVLVYSQINKKPVYDLKNAQIYFEEFIIKFDKQYVSEEEKQYRFNNFKENLKNIIRKNEKNLYAVFDINSMSDLSLEEFRHIRTGLKGHIKDGDCKVIDSNGISAKAPDSFDWRDKKVVTPVKDQGGCGSCWAFSVTGNVESINAIHNGKLVSVSEQQLVDCDSSDLGCHGGDMVTALSYIAASGGIMSEQDYPYKAKDGNCKFDKSKAAVKISGCNAYNMTNEEKVKELLYSVGPLSIGLCAQSIMDYKRGIITSCCDDVDHGVLLVGYGEDKGVPFWTVKNSWSTEWGEKGYFRMKRGENMCSFMDDFSASAVI